MTNHEDSEPPIAKVLNKNYAADLNFSIQYTRWLLTILGIWPHVTSNPTKLAIYLSRLIMPFPTIVITIILVPLASIPFFRDLAPSQYVMLISPFSYRATSVLKHLILILRRGGLRFCIEHMEADWRCIENDADREIMKKNLQVGRSLTVISVLCLYSGATFYNILPFVAPRKLNSLNQTIRPNNVYGSEIYLDLAVGHNYEIVILTGWVSGFWVSTIVMAICNLATVLVCHACGQIQIVMSRLENLVSRDNDEDPDRDSVQKQIALIIPIHVRVLRFATKIDEVLRELCLLEVVSATLIICLVTYLCVTERKNTGTMALISYASLFVSLSFNIFIFCRIGELLKEQFEAVGKAAYMTQWYRLPGKTGLALVMFITMANYPRKLTAGRIVDLSIRTFGNIMRTSFGYVNMLLTMAQ